MISVDYNLITTTQAFPNITTQNMFSSVAADTSLSPVDTFLEDTDEINKLYLSYAINSTDDLPKGLGAMVLLGYTSAVESYFRSVVRRLVNLDDVAKRKAEPMTLSLGAALHHKAGMMPEAILEGYSFTSEQNIDEALKNVLDIKGTKPERVALALREYSRICEIRHCCVHRFGRLGSRNAIKLGLSDHSTILERPFAPTVTDLQEIADLLRTFVKTMNNFIFANIISRTVKRGGVMNDGYSWTWVWLWSRDRHKFKKYYDLFASTKDVTPSPIIREVYDSFLALNGPTVRSTK